MNPAELEGAALDAAVAKALNDPLITMWGDRPWIDDGSAAGHGSSGRGFNPSTDWRDGGPIIERERISVIASDGGDTDGQLTWSACVGQFSYFIDSRLPFDPRYSDNLGHSGQTPLIAAMRAFVASKA